MKKRSKKLKKQFKKLLQSKLQDNLSNFKEEPIEIPKQPEEPKLSPKETTEGKREASFVRKDLKRTFYVTTLILFLMIGLYVYFNYTHSASQFSKAFLKIFGL